MTTNTTSPRTISVPGTTITVTPAMAGLIGLLARAQARQIADNARSANTDAAPSKSAAK